MDSDDPLGRLTADVKAVIVQTADQLRGLKPAPTSQARHDLEDDVWVGQWGTPVRESLTGMVTQLFHSLDCGATYCSLLQEPATDFASSSYWVVARAALEGFARAFYLVGGSPEDRIARALNERFAGQHEHRGKLTDAMKARQEAAWDELESGHRKPAFPAKANMERVRARKVAGQFRETRPSVTALVDGLFANEVEVGTGKETYKRLSAVAHLSPAGLPLVYGTTEGGAPRIEYRRLDAFEFLTALSVGLAPAAEAVTGYFGQANADQDVRRREVSIQLIEMLQSEHDLEPADSRED